MKKLTIKHFSNWMDLYGKASKENDIKASSELFTVDARYYETPFSTPITGRNEIFQYWQKGAQTLKDKESSFEVYSVKGNLGIARWQAMFTVINTGERLSLDCLFLVEFDKTGLCNVFREWWHIKNLEKNLREEGN